ncbi:hypothetical protein JYB87_11330 [Shewanella avicenniae]|uniref:Uncharacterized protein n=1 Tax=Shewanella avicenniae TaxID=2814294 RepID=A0ABX7QM67_9GAMM|nr:hypothetical protein [Shewanella avicenniae]QSX32359.1 hypothetical protein JYB87_11330 [Shewanella avicenniae]
MSKQPETTEFSHFTVLGDGIVGELQDGFECPRGPAIMTMKTWALNADQSADMLDVIGRQIGFEIIGDIQIFETEPECAPSDKPFGYGINFTPYDYE